VVFIGLNCLPAKNLIIFWVYILNGKNQLDFGCFSRYQWFDYLYETNLFPMDEFSNNLNIICLESKAFYALVEQVVERMNEKNGVEKVKWIEDSEAMKLLGISSKTTLQKYRDEGLVRFTQPSRKVILYDRDSIMDFLEQHAKDRF
jgi:hypothetical protein